jgi:hypothetical protein
MAKHVSAKKTAAAGSPKVVAEKAKKAPAKTSSAIAGANAGANASARLARESDDLFDSTFLKKKLNRRALRRLFFRAGVSRTGGQHFYTFVRELIANRVLRDVAGVVAIANYDRLKTLKPEHVAYYYASRGTPIYGEPQYV